MNADRRGKVGAFASVVVGAFFAVAWWPAQPIDPPALEARWQPKASNTKRGTALQQAARLWSNELDGVIVRLSRDAALLVADDPVVERLHARVRELEGTRIRLGAQARDLGIGVGYRRADALDLERFAVALATSIDQTPEAVADVARETLNRVEAAAPSAVRTARGGRDGDLRVADRQQGGTSDATEAP